MIQVGWDGMSEWMDGCRIGVFQFGLFYFCFLCFDMPLISRVNDCDAVQIMWNVHGGGRFVVRAEVTRVWKSETGRLHTHFFYYNMSGYYPPVIRRRARLA